MGILSRIIDAIRARKGPIPFPAPVQPTGLEAGDLLAAHNRIRALYSLAPLKADPRLQGMAYSFVGNLVTRQALDHAGLDSRIRMAGLADYACSENAARGDTSVASVMDGWMNSPGHRQNILGDFTHMGGGFASSDTNYWVVDFAKIR